MQKRFYRAVAAVIATMLLFGLLAGCGGPSDQDLIAKAKAHLTKKDTQAAVIELKTALQKNPGLGEARYLLGTALLQEGNAAAAEVELRKALAAKHPADVVVPELATAMMVQGQAGKVVDEFGGVRLGTNPAQASLQSTLVSAYAAIGKPELSKSALDASLLADPLHAPALLFSAWQQAAKGDFNGAMAVIDAVLGRDPSNSAAWKLKGDILQFALSKPDEAVAAYRKSLVANSKYPASHFEILRVLMRQGNFDGAAKQLDQLKAFAAQDPQTKFLEAQLAYHRKDFKLARVLSQQILRDNPKNARALQLAGAVELQLGALVQAENYLNRAIQVAPELSLARQLMLVTYLRSGQSAKALAVLEVALAKDAVGPDLYSLAGEIYLQSGDAKKAEEYFAKALKVKPDDAGRRTALATARLSNGQVAESIDELKDIAASDSGAIADMALISVYLNRQELGKALAAVDKLEAKQPERPIAANLRGRIQLQQKDNVAARKSFERALAIDADFYPAAASLAGMDQADNKPVEARRRFEALLAKNPNHGRALVSLAGLVVSQGGSKAEVTGLLNRAIEAEPTSVVARLLLVEVLIKNNDFKQALSAAQSAVAARPDSPEVLESLGRAQMASGDLNQAVATFSKLVSMQPQSSLAQIRLASAHAANKNKKSAELSMRKALEMNPDDLRAQRALIVLLLETNKPAEALTVAARIQKRHPKDASGFAIEGDIKAWQRDWPAAANAYQAGFKLSASPELATKLHAALVNAGKVTAADSFAASWLTSNPNDVQFYTALGEAALKRKDLAAAEKSYAAILRVQPTNAVALNNMAWVGLQLKREDAASYAERSIELSPNQPVFMDTLASLLSAKGQHARAIDLQLKATALEPANPSFRLNLAKIFIAAGDKTRAKDELIILVKLGEKHPGYPTANALLKSL